MQMIYALHTHVGLSEDLQEMLSILNTEGGKKDLK